ncbi:MAG: hypothetical protein NVS4B11_09330 [Ktedonobacteraceae bacterium]
MANNYNQQDQPPSQNPQEPQGKLVLGGFQNSPDNARRKPYQYQPPQPQQAQPPQPQQQRNAQQNYPQQQPGYQGYQQNYPQQSRQEIRSNPAQNPYQPGPQRPVPLSPQLPKRRVKRPGGCAIGCLSVLLILVVLGIFAFNTTQRVLAFGSAISTQQPLSTQTSYMSTSDRTNVLIMGYGGGGHDGAYLTDSMSLVSLLPQNHHTSLIAVPRDLFVQYPPNSGQYTKINAVYESAAGYTNKTPKAGGDAAAQKVALITGLDVKYWVTIDFEGFRKLIDSLGGINVYVPDSFNACYPNNDDANKDASWKKVQFNKGMQHMNGETAIEYARAREPLEVCGKGTSENFAELTDFGRSARQQIIVKAVLADVKQMSTWPRLFDAMDALKSTIYTNMSLADLSEFALKMDLNDAKTAHIGLSNQNVLVDDTSSDGQYILQPRNGDWKAIPAYIQQHLYN